LTVGPFSHIMWVAPRAKIRTGKAAPGSAEDTHERGTTGMKLGSEKMKGVVESATVALSDKARLLQAQGLDVINLAGGEPDFDTPAHIVEAAFKSMQAGGTHYVSSRGIPALLNAIAAKYQREQGVGYDPNTEVLVTPGGKMALYAAIMGILDRGDEVLIPEPAWVSYRPMVQLADGVPVGIPLDPNDNFRVTREGLEAAITPRSRAILMCSPSNPTGRVLSRAEMEAIAQVALDHDLLVITDEMYEKLLYEGHEHISMVTLPGMWERTIITNGLSKSHAMTGWRLGFALAPKAIMSSMLKVQQHTTTCAAAFTQAAGAAALNGSQDCVYEMLAVYAGRRTMVVEGLNSLPGVRCPAPEGAFYAFPDIRGTGMTSDQFCALAIDKAQVVMTPGNCFGASGEGFVRLSFANATTKLEQTIERLRRIL
jgi:aspartate aminotransferase